jgi:predicted transposase YbfD/YdcC
MEETRSAALLEHFRELADPRIDRHKEHKLLDVLVIAICAILWGANDWVAVETFGEAKREWFTRFLDLTHGIPSHDTFGRVFGMVSPEALQTCFLRWIQAVAQVTEGQVVAIDGKTLRRSYDRRSAKAAIHMVSAWATHNRVVLGQLKTEEKSNEITAIPELLKVLDVSGGIVTIDAMGCQKAIAEQIGEQAGEYVLALKQNHETLYAAVVQQFADARDTPSEAAPLQVYETEEQRHGRVEIRRHWTLEAPPDLVQKDAWAQLRCLGMVESERQLNGQVTLEQRYISPAFRMRCSCLPTPSARIGGLRIVFTGCWMWPFGKMSPGSDWAMRRRISPCCATSPSLSYAKTRAPNSGFTTNGSKRAGMTRISLTSSLATPFSAIALPATGLLGGIPVCLWPGRF